ncbi:hypothetical protein [Ectobacillus sp. sgz5001026]|uniref:hypothetical protein n=1 Tax=Ectobacillus sp. sgz5001026 TaxID=3242473 RepID=UPI0036D27E4A
MESFSAGDIYSFEGRKSDPSPQIIILGKEPFLDTTAVHVQIIGIELQISDGQTLTKIGHVPVCEESLRNSVIDYLGKANVPDDELEGIKVWKEAKGGIYTVSLKEIVNIIERTLHEEE